MARYMTIISLVANGIGPYGLLVVESISTAEYNALGFYGKHFTPATCKHFYMLPNVTAMLAGMAAQILVFIRTYTISANSTFVCYGLGGVLLLGFPVQIFGIVYHRDVALVVFGRWVSSPEIIGNHVTEVLSVDRYA
ncbi:hypothetical protein B0H10DRAFT_2197732 [Mycena sp. CBHHK59/15]|nr:hypothetical protein B0H10DRAFT_2197732 [Mycena sp. CBHHK59/15]